MLDTLIELQFLQIEKENLKIPLLHNVSICLNNIKSQYFLNILSKWMFLFKSRDFSLLEKLISGI